MIWPYLRQVAMSKYTAFVLRMCVGCFFLYASTSKIPYPAQFAEATANYRLVPYCCLNLGAVILPWVEFVCGLFLIVGFLSRASAILIGFMIILFNIMVLINMYWGAPITCGCFDTVGEPIGWKKITENFVMLIFIIQIYYFDRLFTFRRGGLSDPAKIMVTSAPAWR
ncbi:MAG: MauE/DoxX family redox-associated membrane protein [Syntrophobacteraceae bacterium]